MIERDPRTGALLKVCPHCGTASQTLGSRCPACDRPYFTGDESGEESWIDAAPFIDAEDVFPGGGWLAGWMLVGIVNVVIAVVWTPFFLLRRGVRLLFRRGR
jgi:hypothetical protein